MKDLEPKDSDDTGRVGDWRVAQQNKAADDVSEQIVFHGDDASYFYWRKPFVYVWWHFDWPESIYRFSFWMVTASSTRSHLDYFAFRPSYAGGCRFEFRFGDLAIVEGTPAPAT